MSKSAWVLCALALLAVVLGGAAHQPEYIQVGDMVIRADSTKFRTFGNDKFSIMTGWNSDVDAQWTTSTIPYTLDASLTADQKANIAAAIAIYNAQTCVRFVENNAAANKITFRGVSDGCVANVGNVLPAGPQVNISSGCLTLQIVHEMGHTLGFSHTMQRADRNRFANVPDGRVTANNVDQYNLETDPSMLLLGAYDYHSVMHYAPGDFAISPANPAMVLPTSAGTQVSLSDTDVDRVNFVFLGCPAAGQKAIKCISSYPFNQTYPSVPKVAVGYSLDVMMNVNVGPSPLADRTTTVTYTATNGVTVNAASGTTIQAPGAVKLTFTPTAAQAGTIVDFPVNFASNGLTATCTQSVWILPAPPATGASAATVECFGLLPGNSAVCSGHGTCAALDTCVCATGFYGRMCNRNTPENIDNSLHLIGEINGNQQFNTGTLGANTYTQAYAIPETTASAAGTRDVNILQLATYISVANGGNIKFEFIDPTTNLVAAEIDSDFSQTTSGLFTFQPDDLTRIPRTGTLKLTCSNCFWNAATADNQHKMDFQGYIVCNDGYFGANCGSVCPGGASANQCSKNGLCNDGIAGTGTCSCWAGTGTTCAASATTPPTTQPAPQPAPAPVTPIIPSPQPQPAVVGVTTTTTTTGGTTTPATSRAPAVTAPSGSAFMTVVVTFIVNGVKSSFTTTAQQNFRAAIAQSIGGISANDVIITDITEVSTSRKFTSSANALRVGVSTLAPTASYASADAVVARLQTAVRANNGNFGGTSVSTVTSSTNGNAATTVLPSVVLAIVSVMAAVVGMF